jgi:NADPH:quinone reductase-like Zn-dependent oxidoreductase
VSSLLAGGGRRVTIAHTYDLADAGEALRALVTGHTQGKLAIQVT